MKSGQFKIKFFPSRTPAVLKLSLGGVCLAASAAFVFAVGAYDPGPDRPREATGRPPNRVEASEPGYSSLLVAPATGEVPTEVELITITPRGFEPKEITRREGPFVLAVENRSGLQGVQLRIDRDAGPRLHDAPFPRARHDWHAPTNLTPGRYVVSEAYNPDWSCVITITPK